MVGKSGRAHLRILRIVNNSQNAATCRGHAANTPFGDARLVSASLGGRALGMATPSAYGRRRAVVSIGGEIPPQVCAPLWKRLKTRKAGADVYTPMSTRRGARAGGGHV